VQNALDFARNSVYPDSVKADVSAERLQRFFTRQDQGYRVSRELGDVIVFTDHDLLADPPFSRLNLISCRQPADPSAARGTAEGLIALSLRAE
jgi:two-component system, chemotaxis family, CheB/CheR fusion protein